MHDWYHFLDDYDKANLEDGVFYPRHDTKANAEEIMKNVIATLNVITSSAENAVFAVPGPEGALLSAGISMIWGTLKPSVAPKVSYTESVSNIMSKVSKDAFSIEALSTARHAIENFSGVIHTDANHMAPNHVDDIPIAQERANKLLDFYAKGSLEDAYFKILDHLPFFDATVHTLLISAILSIQQAYAIALYTYQCIAIFGLDNNLEANYNQAQAKINSILDDIADKEGTFESYVSKAKSRIEDLKKQRLNGCYINEDRRTLGWKSFPVKKWVCDPETAPSPGKSPKEVFVVETDEAADVALAVQALNPWSDLLQTNENFFKRTMERALQAYKKKLTPHMEKDFEDMVTGLDGVANNSKKLFTALESRHPRKPKHGPRPVLKDGAKVMVKATGMPPAGTPISFLYELFIEIPSIKTPGKPDYKRICSSPWSDMSTFGTVEEGGNIPQMHIADGGATVPTLRKIYLKTTPDDAKCTLVGHVYGLGIIEWPEVKHPEIS